MSWGDDVLAQREMVELYEDLCNGVKFEYIPVNFTKSELSWLKEKALQSRLSLNRYLMKLTLEMLNENNI